eukprot:5138819-Prymnesium_polylepis.1
MNLRSPLVRPLRSLCPGGQRHGRHWHSDRGRCLRHRLRWQAESDPHRPQRHGLALSVALHHRVDLRHVERRRVQEERVDHVFQGAAETPSEDECARAERGGVPRRRGPEAALGHEPLVAERVARVQHFGVDPRDLAAVDANGRRWRSQSRPACRRRRARSRPRSRLSSCGPCAKT